MRAASGSRLTTVQALRAIAAVLVVLYHVGNATHGIEARLFPRERPLLEQLFGTFGTFRIDVFFVISGFVLTATTAKSFGEPAAWAHFLRRRALRVYPPYWLALAPLVLIAYLTSWPLMPSHAGHRPSVLADLLLVPQRLPTMIVSWSLSYEIAFYLMFGLALRFPNRAFAGPALALWAVAQTGLYVAFHGSHDPLLHFAGSLLPLDFIAGVAIGRAYLRGALPFAWPAAACALGASGMLWSGVVMLGANLGLPNGAPAFALRLLCAALLVYAAVALEVTARVRAPRWIVALGDASYALYLWHLSILFALGYALRRLHPHGLLEHAASLGILLAATLYASTLIYRFLEKPLVAAAERVVLGHGTVPQPVRRAS